jgi:putative two-component system response regulator
MTSRAPDLAAERRVLVIDDEPSIREPLSRFLVSRGLEVLVADGAESAIAMLDRYQFGAILCDVRMPGRSGLDLLPVIRERDTDCAVIMLTGLNDAATATEAIALGAVDYITKPVELEHLARAITTALERRRMQIEQRDLQQLIREEVALRTASLEREKLALRAHAIDALATIATLTDARIPFHSGQSQRVSSLAARLAHALALDADTIELIEIAGRIHDIGKLAIPDAILVKTAPLTADEIAIVREHVIIGVELLTPLRHLAPLLPYVRDHHERWDGTGYPSGLRGEAISIGGRILAVADAFVAVTAGRPYFSAYAPRDAVAYLTTRAGTHFDPAVIAALQSIVTE